MAKILVFLFLAVSAWARDLDKLYAKANFELGGHKIDAYIADTGDKRAQGLMFIEKIAADRGMLFVFEKEEPLGFWMKNTLIPLSIGFFDAHGNLIDVQEMKIANSLMDLDPPTYQSRGPAAFALEMNTGWFAKHNVAKGTRLTLKSKSAQPLLSKRLGRSIKSGQ